MVPLSGSDGSAGWNQFIVAAVWHRQSVAWGDRAMSGDYDSDQDVPGEVYVGDGDSAVVDAVSYLFSRVDQNLCFESEAWFSGSHRPAAGAACDWESDCGQNKSN